MTRPYDESLAVFSQRLQPLQQLRKGSNILRERFSALRQARTHTKVPTNQREICYEAVGCFQASRKRSPLMKVPQAPHEIDTKFLLYKRENIGPPQTIKYGDNMFSLKSSNFSIHSPVKILIHGYKGSSSDQAALWGVSEFLKLMDANIIFLDWTKGAAGPSYPVSVANTELVGRQLALLLFDILTLGSPEAKIHLVGFSLGAHIAACASYILQKRGVKVGRITGLDPASPIYKSTRLLEAHRKLDKDDAHFVDVIHTDGSPVWTNGFGLLQPLGHVDFYPNGGEEQAGCNDGRASLVVSHFEGTVNSSTVCSHVRAWRLFVESLTYRDGGCQFTAYPCPGGQDRYHEGSCFPNADTCKTEHVCAQMGIDADKSKARGPLFLVTRETSPYCGLQLRSTVFISERTPRTRGIVLMKLKHGSSHTNFKMHYEFPDVIQGGRAMWGLAAAEFGSIDLKKKSNLTAVLNYQSLVFQSPDKTNNEEIYYNYVPLFIDKVTLSDIHGNNWYYCNKETLLEENMSSSSGLTIMLSPKMCTV
ncbi:hypothetical protein R5R35_006043 [Gryllus longicercus]|uniref:Lipase domain-containing protein n=1 Tax=Gryllus longicercus TaxID=2509291 RepID=A0AAN9Z719_9ORTH